MRYRLDPWFAIGDDKVHEEHHPNDLGMVDTERARFWEWMSLTVASGSYPHIEDTGVEVPRCCKIADCGDGC